MKKATITNQKGFTLVELMIATTVFSVILLGATTAVIQIGRMYYKGVIASRSQETARRVIDEISRAIQFNSGEITNPLDGTGQTLVVQQGAGTKIGVSSVCVGTTRFTYALNAQVVDDSSIDGYYDKNNTHTIRHALWRDTVTDSKICAVDPGAQNPTAAQTAHFMPDLTQVQPSSGMGGSELLSQYMRLTQFSVPTSGGDLQSVAIGVLYGDDDLLEPDANNPAGCKSLALGAQWCALSTLKTSVFQRVKSGQ